MSEVEEVAQVLRVSLEGVQVAMSITGAFWHNGKDMMKLFWNVLHREKLQGKTNMKHLLLKGGDLQIFQFPEQYKSQIMKALTGYGVLFSQLPDLNRKDGLSEILFHAEATNRVNSLIENLNTGHFIDMEQYFGNAKESEVKEEEAYFHEHFVPAREPDRLSTKESDEMVNRMKILGAKENPTMEDITITKKLVIEEKEDAYLTRIPYERDKFFWVKKTDSMWINEGKTLLAKLEKKREYEVLDKKGEVREKIDGQRLYKENYDEVSIATKRRAMEQSERVRKEKVRQKNAIQKQKKGRG